MLGLEARNTRVRDCRMLPYASPCQFCPSIIARGGIGFRSRTLPVRTVDTLIGQHYISEMLEPVVLPSFQILPTATMQQDNARPHTTHNVWDSFVINWIESAASTSLFVRSLTCWKCLQNNWPRIHHPLLHQISSGNVWKQHGMLYSNNTLRSTLI